MAREVGTFPFSANFEVGIEGTLDARQLVDDFSDLLNFTSEDYIPQGFPVVVKGTTTIEERGIYLCVDNQNLGSASSWEKVGGSLDDVESDKTYVHNQSTNSTEWVINHNLNKLPSITVLDSAENTVIGNVEYLDNNNVKITFNFPFSGKATLN